MEVHAHTHTPRKKWTHYFWEFLMLFLAVFCGFLAEYKLEHMIEHQRAKIYAINLHNELINDTSRLKELIELNNVYSGQLDTLCLFGTEKEKRNLKNGALYYYAKYVMNVVYFSPNTVTIEELKGSGNLRLMKARVANKISEYDKKFRELENEYRLSRVEFEKIEELYFKIFDAYLIHSDFLMETNESSKRDSVFNLNPPLVNNDPKLMKEFIGWLRFETGIYRTQNSAFHIPLKQLATELLALLKEEYHLK